MVMPFAGPLNAFTLDRTGVLYTTANQGFNNYVVAVQTDALPAVGGAVCRNVGCTPARDGWAR